MIIIHIHTQLGNSDDIEELQKDMDAYLKIEKKLHVMVGQIRKLAKDIRVEVNASNVTVIHQGGAKEL